VRVPFALLLISVLGVACASTSQEKRVATLASENERSRASGERKLVRSGDLWVGVDDPVQMAREVGRLVEAVDGFVQRSDDQGETSHITCRVPVSELDSFLDSVASLGTEERRSLRTNDVTDQYFDLQARLNNDRALRDRLQKLLDRAESIDDILSIEKELNRIQTEIERMQARFDRLESEIELSTVSIALRKRVVLGPLGYVGYGVWWALSKLFVISP